MRVRLTPNTGERARVFEVLAASLETAKGELTLTCRDGRICLGLQGSWEMSIQDSVVRPMSCDEAERIHDGSALVVMAN